jgi:hypothetical protein
MSGIGVASAGGTVASFQGLVRCAPAPGAPAFTLSGTTVEGEPLALTFSAQPPAGLPSTLEAPRIDHLEGGSYRICASGGEWRLTARAVHLHRAVPSFDKVIEPRTPPWHRRLVWWLLVTLLAQPAGRALLRRLRGQGGR